MWRDNPVRSQKIVYLSQEWYIILAWYIGYFVYDGIMICFTGLVYGIFEVYVWYMIRWWSYMHIWDYDMLLAWYMGYLRYICTWYMINVIWYIGLWRFFSWRDLASVLLVGFVYEAITIGGDWPRGGEPFHENLKICLFQLETDFK